MSIDDLKKSIRSLLTSTPNALTIDRLDKDYREFFGENIPFHKFGYNSLEQFLKSNPDVCVVSGSGKFATITPCVSEKAAHINEMVMRQKKTVPKSKKAPRFQTRGNYSQYTPPVVKRTMYTYAISPCTSSNSSAMSSANSNRNQYHTKSSWTIQNFVPPQLMYSNVQNSYMNNNQAVYNRKSYVKPEPPAVPVISKQQLVPLNDSIKKNEQPKIDSTANCNMSGITNKMDTVSNQTNRGHNITRKLSPGEQNVLESRKKHLEALIQKQMECGNVSKSPEQQQAGTHIDSVMSSTPQAHVSSSRLNSKIFPDDAPVLEEEDQHMFTSKTLELFKPYIKQQGSSPKLPSFSTNNEQPPDSVAEPQSNVPPAVQERLQKLIAQYEDGIWCAELPAIYTKQFRRELRFHEYGYTSLIEMCMSLKNVFHYVRPGKDDFKLYDCTKPLPDTVKKNCTMASCALREPDDEPDLSMEDGFPRKLRKEDFLISPTDIFFEEGVEIPRQFLPAGTKVDSILDVVVVEAYDPSKFWIYMGTSDKNCDLDILMNDVQSFFANPKNRTEYAIPPALVSVYFIDYGTVARTPIQGALFLPQRFAELPAQAIRCRLSNVVPVAKGGPWPKEASEFFRRQVDGRDTKIKISYIDWDEEYLCVFLADVTDCKKITYVNDVLVKEGHALWDGEEQKIPFVLPNYKTKVQNLHLFPTFLELECGMAPNVADMLHLEAMQVPINFCIPQYFDWIDDEASEEEEELERHQEHFIETVRNNRRCPPWGIPITQEEPEFKFSIFGELEQEMREFKEMIDNQNDGYSDQAYVDQETDQGDSQQLDDKRHIENLHEFSESILKKLEGEDQFDSKQPADSPDSIDLMESEIVESELSMLLERGGSDSDSIFGDDKATMLREDINIFDNPEYFKKDGLYEDSESSPDAGMTPDSFLRKIEKMSTPVTPHSESGSSNFMENPFLSKSRTDLSNAASEKSKSLESSLKSFINRSLKKSQYEREKKKSQHYDSDDSSNSSLESFVAMAIGFRRQAKLMDSIKSSVAAEPATVDYFAADDFRVPSRADTKADQDADPLNLQFKSNLEKARTDFASTLSLTNPFRSFLTTDNAEKVRGIEEMRKSFEKLQAYSPDSTETTLIPPRGGVISESTNEVECQEKNESRKSDVEPLLEFKVPFNVIESEEEKKVDMPVGSVASTSSSVGSSRSSILSTCSTPNASSTPFIPSNFFEPPSMPTPPYAATYGVPQNPGFTHPNSACGPQNSPYGPPNPTYGPQNPGPYPSWADGSGFPSVPPYHHWSNGNTGTAPLPLGTGANFGFNNQQHNLRPPPGFAPRFNSNAGQNFNPNAPSFHPNAPIFNPNAPSFYPVNQQRFTNNFNQPVPYMTQNMPPFNPYMNHHSNYVNYMQPQRHMTPNTLQYPRNVTYFQGSNVSQLRPTGADFYERYNQEITKEQPATSSDETRTLCTDSDDKNSCKSQTVS